MEHKTSLASGIEVTQAKEKYDAAWGMSVRPV